MPRSTRHRRAAAASQYALIVGLIAVVAIAAIGAIGGNLRALMTNVSNRLVNAGDGQTTGGAGSGGATAVPTRASCLAHFQAGQTANGTYPVSIGGGPAQALYCDMTNGGWTLVLRAYGGSRSGAGWQTNAALAAGTTMSPTMAESFKLSDSEINTVRGGGIYRIGYNGSANPPSVAPGVFYVPSGCTYNHTAAAAGACLQYSASQSLTPLSTSATNMYRLAIVIGDTATNSGLIHYLLNFNSSGGSPTGTDSWYAGNVSGNGDWCYGSQAGCNITLFVR